MSIISAKGLTVYYNKRRGIEDVNLHIEPGEIFGFLGPNGSGKTTTIRVLMGYLKSTEGSANVMGLDCWKQSHQIKKEVGYIPGDLRLYPWMTGNSALQIFGMIRKKNLRPAANEFIELFGLDMKVPVRKMSSGMKQKLGLLLALVHKPKLFILDEPTSALDPLAQQKLIETLRKLASEGHTIFFSSHSLSEVEQLCHRVAIIREGKIVANESIEDLKKRAKKLVTIRFQNEEGVSKIKTPDFLIDKKSSGFYRQYELSGTSQQLVEWLSHQEYQDLTVSPPDLENLFHQYYISNGDEIK
jgi:beta-exotoxin I transport system ATP-binding protein